MKIPIREKTRKLLNQCVELRMEKKTYEEIGEKVGLSKQRVSSLINQYAPEYSKSVRREKRKCRGCRRVFETVQSDDTLFHSKECSYLGRRKYPQRAYKSKKDYDHYRYEQLKKNNPKRLNAYRKRAYKKHVWKLVHDKKYRKHFYDYQKAYHKK